MDTTTIKRPYTKRFIIEDSITKVTTDGKPHELMTIIAAFSGLITALIILGILLFFLTSKRFNSVHQCHRCSLSSSLISNTPSGFSDGSSGTDGTQSKRTSIETIYEDGEIYNSRSASVSTIFNGNLHTNLATAFHSNELTLPSCLSKSGREKKFKRTHWPDDDNNDTIDNNNRNKKKQTTIQLERY